MLELIGVDGLTQWDVGRQIKVDKDIDMVHFSNRPYGYSKNVKVTAGVADVPDMFLTSCAPLRVWAYVGDFEKGYTKIEKIYEVKPKNRPEDYIYTPEDVKTWEKLQSEIGDLANLETKAKDNLVAAINEAVLYTAQSLTEEEQAQARANIGAQDLYNGLTPVSYSCTDGTYSVSDTVYLESGNIISPTDTVSNDVRLAFRCINFWSIPTQLDYWKDDIKKYKLLIDNGYLENNTIWYSKPDKKLKKQIRFGTHSTLGNYIIFNFNYDYEVIGQLVYYVDTDTISTGIDTYLNYKLTRDKNNVLSYSAIKLSSDPTEPMQIATKQYVDNAPIKQASATELGGVKADSAETTDTQPVRIGGDGKLYTAASGTDISLGLTSAAVGQIIKVKAIDASGKPTAWEAADMPSGDRWELINAIEIPDGAEETNALRISADKNGNAFSLKKARLITYFPKYTGESSIPGYSFTMINGFNAGPQAPLCYTSGLPSPNNSNNIEGWLEVDLSMPGYEVERVARFAGSGGRPTELMFWGARRLNGAETITSIGGTNMLIYPGCKFMLYGVRA